MTHIIEIRTPKLSSPCRRRETFPKSAAQQQANEREPATTPVVRQAPPPPGMGKLVDKTA